MCLHVGGTGWGVVYVYNIERRSRTKQQGAYNWLKIRQTTQWHLHWYCNELLGACGQSQSRYRFLRAADWLPRGRRWSPGSRVNPGECDLTHTLKDADSIFFYIMFFTHPLPNLSFFNTSLSLLFMLFSPSIPLCAPAWQWESLAARSCRIASTQFETHISLSSGCSA